ncbi:MAG: hypothetical protein IT562_16005 [Alphaproteobacteria bacterium]|nr:hypothetical protein [Alphaproteobacteria bacterium]
MQTALLRSMVLAAALAMAGLALGPALAQNGQPKRAPTAAEKLGGEPVATKEEAELRSRQQQELDAALKQDVYIGTPIPAKTTQGAAAPGKPDVAPPKDGAKGKQVQDIPPRKPAQN